ncbi:MAG: hypothetical protein DWQ31_02675 [Planctomycetota bacterium]|nr:MAG: hypothetical protein DWQ31_02675 [Planctomycetota bacterium]
MEVAHLDPDPGTPHCFDAPAAEQVPAKIFASLASICGFAPRPDRLVGRNGAENPFDIEQDASTMTLAGR